MRLNPPFWQSSITSITPSITPQSRYHSGRVIDVIDVIDVFNLLEFYLCGAQNNNLNP